MSRKIIVDYVYPPIRVRSYAAYFDGEEERVGYGATPREAIEELRGGDECAVCNGDDAGTPCAYPSANMAGCFRDERLAVPTTIGKAKE